MDPGKGVRESGSDQDQERHLDGYFRRCQNTHAYSQIFTHNTPTFMCKPTFTPTHLKPPTHMHTPTAIPSHLHTHTDAHTHPYIPSFIYKPENTNLLLLVKNSCSNIHLYTPTYTNAGSYKPALIHPNTSIHTLPNIHTDTHLNKVKVPGRRTLFPNNLRIVLGEPLG